MMHFDTSSVTEVGGVTTQHCHSIISSWHRPLPQMAADKFSLANLQTLAHSMLGQGLIVPLLGVSTHKRLLIEQLSLIFYMWRQHFIHNL